MVVGYLHDISENDKYFGYFWVGIYYLIACSCSFVLIIFIIVYDKWKLGSKINKLIK